MTARFRGRKAGIDAPYLDSSNAVHEGKGGDEEGGELHFEDIDLGFERVGWVLLLI